MSTEIITRSKLQHVVSVCFIIYIKAFTSGLFHLWNQNKMKYVLILTALILLAGVSEILGRPGGKGRGAPQGRGRGGGRGGEEEGGQQGRRGGQQGRGRGSRHDDHDDDDDDDDRPSRHSIVRRLEFLNLHVMYSVSEAS